MHNGKRRDEQQPADCDVEAIRSFLAELYRTHRSRKTSARKLASVRALDVPLVTEYFHAHAVFLRACSKPVFFDFLRREYPHLAGHFGVPVTLAVFVTAFSLMADGWRDALDPKLRGAE